MLIMLLEAFEGKVQEESDSITGFISDYMGGTVCEGDDYFIGDDYVSLNFMECDEYPYDEEPLYQFMCMPLTGL